VRLQLFSEVRRIYHVAEIWRHCAACGRRCWVHVAG